MGEARNLGPSGWVLCCNAASTPMLWVATTKFWEPHARRRAVASVVAPLPGSCSDLTIISFVTGSFAGNTGSPATRGLFGSQHVVVMSM